MGLLWIHGSEDGLPKFKLINEPSLTGVDTLAWAVVDQWRLPFFIHKHLKSPLHLQIAPVWVQINQDVILVPFSDYLTTYRNVNSTFYKCKMHMYDLMWIVVSLGLAQLVIEPNTIMGPNFWWNTRSTIPCSVSLRMSQVWAIPTSLQPVRHHFRNVLF